MNEPPIFPTQPVSGTKESLELFNAGVLWNNRVGFNQYQIFPVMPPDLPQKPDR